MKKTYLTIAMAALAMAGCSKVNTYSPAANASAGDIFKGACAECHKTQNGKLFELAGDKANEAAIVRKVSDGGILMPSFPNIKAEALTGLGKYVIENSSIK